MVRKWNMRHILAQNIYAFLLSRIMIISVSIFLVGCVKVKLMRYFESSEIT